MEYQGRDMYSTARLFEVHRDLLRLSIHTELKELVGST